MSVVTREEEIERITAASDCLDGSVIGTLRWIATDIVNTGLESDCGDDKDCCLMQVDAIISAMSFIHNIKESVKMINSSTGENSASQAIDVPSANIGEEQVQSNKPALN